MEAANPEKEIEAEKANDTEEGREKEAESIEEAVDEDPKNDARQEASRGESSDDVVEPKLEKHEDVEPTAEANEVMKEANEDVNTNVVIEEDPKYDAYEKAFKEPIAAESSQPTPQIHGHFEHAVRSILDDMDQQNDVIKELLELLDSKIFTDNQKEKLTWGKLREIKSYIESIGEELKRTTFRLKKSLFELADLISDKIKDQSSLFKDHLALTELKIETGSMNLQHLMD
ncbi:hypothetical protein Dimus_002869 [Dionaea muscipula]